MESPSDLLKRVNADNFAVLYRCRWSPQEAEAIVPQLVGLLRHGIPEVVAESLRALGRISSLAFPAAPAVATLVSHADPIVRHLAVWTLGRICLDHPEGVIEVLVQAASDPDLRDPAMFALINFGPGALAAASFFVGAYQSPDAKTRRLAVRGLRASGAQDTQSLAVLRRAQLDRSADVRKAAARAREQALHDRS